MSIILVSSTSDDLWLFIMAVFKSCKLETFLGCISLGKILIRILNPKTDFLFPWQNPKRDPMNPCAMKIQWINPNSDY